MRNSFIRIVWKFQFERTNRKTNDENIVWLQKVDRMLSLGPYNPSYFRLSFLPSTGRPVHLDTSKKNKRMDMYMYYTYKKCTFFLLKEYRKPNNSNLRKECNEGKAKGSPPYLSNFVIHLIPEFRSENFWKDRSNKNKNTYFYLFFSSRETILLPKAAAVRSKDSGTISGRGEPSWKIKRERARPLPTRLIFAQLKWRGEGGEREGRARRSKLRQKYAGEGHTACNPTHPPTHALVVIR